MTTAPAQFRQPVDTSDWASDWDEAFFYASVVGVNSFGLTEDEVVEIARSMRRRPLPEPGWDLPGQDATWRAAARERRPDEDGCQSLFC